MKRSGMSLLEVLVALAIFLMSLVALGQLIGVGGDIALEMDWRSQAALRAESKMAEVVAGVEPLESLGNVPFEDDPSYTWSLEVAGENVPNLYRVTVIVNRPRRDGTAVEVVLSQYVYDPRMMGAAVIPETPEAVPATGTSDAPQ